MCDIYEEACFYQKKIFTNRKNMGLSLWAKVEKKQKKNSP